MNPIKTLIVHNNTPYGKNAIEFKFPELTFHTATDEGHVGDFIEGTQWGRWFQNDLTK